MGFFNNKPCATADRTTQALNTLCALLSLRYLDGIATIYSVKIAGRELVFTFVLAGIPDYVHTLSVPVLDIQDNGHTLITGRMHCSTPFLEAALNRLARGRISVPDNETAAILTRLRPTLLAPALDSRLAARFSAKFHDMAHSQA